MTNMEHVTAEQPLDDTSDDSSDIDLMAKAYYTEHKVIVADEEATRNQPPYRDDENRARAEQLRQDYNRKSKVGRTLLRLLSGTEDPMLEEAWRLEGDAGRNESQVEMGRIDHTMSLERGYANNLVDAKKDVDTHLPEYIAAAKKEAEAAGVSVNIDDK